MQFLVVAILSLVALAYAAPGPHANGTFPSCSLVLLGLERYAVLLTEPTLTQGANPLRAL
jgi:hypothetical protein